MRRWIAMLLLSVGCGGSASDGGDGGIGAKYCGFSIDPVFESVASSDQAPPTKPVVKSHTVTRTTSMDPSCEGMVEITFDIEASDDTTPPSGLGYVVSVTGGTDILPHTSGPARAVSNRQIHLFVSSPFGFLGTFDAWIFDGGGNRSEPATYSFVYTGS